MNKNTQSSMLDVQTNLLAGLFILLVLVAINVGKGGRYDVESSNGGGEEYLSTVEYKEYDQRKKDLAIVHAYIELEEGLGQNLRFELAGLPAILDSCTLVYTPYKKSMTWAVSRKGPVQGNWQLDIKNAGVLKKPIKAKVHILNGTVHMCSRAIIINRQSHTLLSFVESGDFPPSVNICDI